MGGGGYIERRKKGKIEYMEKNDWSTEISQLEEFFVSAQIPKPPVRLDDWTVITDCDTFIDSHIAAAKNYNGNKHFQPFIERLIKFKEICKILSATQNKKKK